MPRVKLGDVAREYKAVSKDNSTLPIVGLEHLTPGDITLDQWDEGVETTFTKAFKKGQMLFGRRRAYLKKAALAPFDGICSGDIIVIEAIPDKINPALLPFIIQNDLLFDFAVGNSAGSLSPRVKWESLKEYEFELPEIDKQECLVQLLEAAHQAKKGYQNLIEATDDLVKSQFIEMFGDPVTNLMGWPRKAFKETCTLMTGNTPSRAVKEYYGKYIEWIKSDNITTESLYLTIAAEYLSETGSQVGRIVPAGAVLMTCIAGSLNTIGNVAISDRNVAFNQQINAFIPHEYETLFLCYLLKLLKPQLHEAASSALKCILNKGNLESFVAIVPERGLQKEFSFFANQADKSKFELKQAIERIDNLIKSLIQQG